jgi:hypothetical protein
VAYSIDLNKKNKFKQIKEFFHFLTSHSISNGTNCVVYALTPTGFDRGRHVVVEHMDSDIGLGSLAPTRLYAITRNV